jgi:predicted CoA-substrate-specific enzyme activase
MKALGLDAGSLTIKTAILDGQHPPVFSVLAVGDDVELSAKTAIDEVISKARVSSNDVFIVSTGLGSKSISLSNQQKAITTCIARGIHHLLPSARTVIDLGAESSTIIKVNERGRVTDSAGQDKCAAGTGMFLQAMAKVMQVSPEQMSEMSLKARSKAEITGTCAVFAESEVISHIHRVPPTPKEDIIAGIHASMVSRIKGLLKRLGIEKDVAVIGGVARNQGLISILEKELGYNVLVPENPDIVAALGAAFLAKEIIDKDISK